MKTVIFGMLLGFVVLFILASCDTKSKTGVDGYRFEQETFTRTSFTTDVVLVQSELELKKIYTDNGGKGAKNLAAFATLSQTENKCTIYMIDPKVSYEPEYFGHELVHCIYGDWHKDQ